MTTRLVKIQLLAFTIITFVAVGYGSVRYFGLGEIFRPPYEVSAQFSSSGGIYPRADVDLLGTRIGTVREVRPGPRTGTTVVMAIDHDIQIPQDVDAEIGNKSAIGEQYVELTPKSSGGRVLAAGEVIPMARTTSPTDISTLFNHLDELAESIPTQDLSVVMNEVSTAVQGLGPVVGRLLDDTDVVTRTSLEHVDELTTLIDDASVVLGTQVDKSPKTIRYLDDLGSLSTSLRHLDGTASDVFANGIKAGSQVSSLLNDIQAALPALLSQLLAITDLTADRLPAVRKTLAIFPWTIELLGTSFRACGQYDPNTGKPLEKTCRYDVDGKPFYSAYLAAQLPELPGKPPYFACTKGYEGTTKYLPNGVPVNGSGRQGPDSQPNMAAHCAAPPNDPNTPNVRGAQNASH